MFCDTPYPDRFSQSGPKCAFLIGVRINNAVIDPAVQLSTRYIGDRRHLEKSIDLVEEAVARLRTMIDPLSKELGTMECKIRQWELNVKHSSPRRKRRNLLHLRSKSGNE